MYWRRLGRRLARLNPYGYRVFEHRIRILPRRRPMHGVYPQAVLHDTYSFRARAVQRATRLFLQPVLRVVPINATTIRAIRALEWAAAKGPRSKLVEPVGYTLGGVSVESMTHRFTPSSAMTILYFHGGGFFSGSIDSHRRICENLARFSGANVISVDYVQLPDGVVADSVRDAINAYEGLLEVCPEPDKIVVAGDSAGGYLAMKVAELATRRGLPVPAAVLGFSPLLSLDPDREDKAVERLDRVHDAYLPPKRLPKLRALWQPSGSAIEGCAAPLEASAYITSPVFMTAVEDELLRPEVEALSVLLAERGVRVDTHIWRKQVHAFPFLADFLPEGRHALRLAAAFARGAVGEGPDPDASTPVAGPTTVGRASTPVAVGDVWEGELLEALPREETVADIMTDPEAGIIDSELVEDRRNVWFSRTR